MTTPESKTPRGISPRAIGIDGPKPFLYYVLADLPDAPRVNVPMVSAEPDVRAFRHASYPHQFDTHLASAIPLLAYILNLPRAPLDLFYTHQGDVPQTRPDWHAHAVYVVPVQDLRPLFPDWTPALVLAPDAFLDEARQLSTATHAMLGAASPATLSPDLVIEHWRELWRRHCDPRRFVPVAPAALLDVSRIAGELPARFRGRRPIETGVTTGLSAEEGAGQRQLSLVWPGVGGLYKRTLKQQILEVEDDGIDFRTRVESDTAIERSVFSLLATHSALRAEGDALVLPELPRSAFSALVRAERGFNPRTTDPPGIWRALSKISEVIGRTTTPEAVSRIEEASTLKIFANFPVGLADPGSRGTPLALRTPIAYLPLQPLTANLGYEFRAVPKLPFHGRSPSVLFAECIPDRDPVGHVSRQSTARIVRKLTRTGRFDVEAIDALNVGTLRDALKSSYRDVLVLSAHGASDPDTGASGIICGNRLVTGYELGRSAAVVILSACRVNPRGHGTIGIVDELLNLGALAVAGTLVPICAHRNALLLERLLTLLADWTAGSKRSNFLEIWWAALYYTSAMDIVLSDAHLTSWILGKESTYRDVMSPVFEDLTSTLSSAGTYDFYDRAFQQISDADSRRPEGPLLHGKPWRDFVLPESLMYMIFGWPENIVV